MFRRDDFVDNYLVVEISGSYCFIILVILLVDDFFRSTRTIRLHGLLHVGFSFYL